MAKKTTTKKSGRKLKRTVRRSLSAILMITAIAVAAIPVPENLAEEDTPGVDTTPVVQYVAARGPETEPGGEGDNYEQNYDITKNEYADEDAESDKVEEAVEAGELNATEVIIEDVTGTFLIWQFLYKPSGNTAGILCKYNDMFSVTKVSLGLQPIESYYTVTFNDYEGYFSNPATDTSENFYMEMDNLGVNGAKVTGTVYPTDNVVYSYEKYDYATNGMSSQLNQAEKAFLNTYYASDVEAATARFKAYYEAYLAAEDKSSVGEPPESLTGNPQNLSPTDKIKFFCEHNIVLKGTGYSLKAVTDYRYGQEGDIIYVAYGGDASNLEPGITGKTYEDYEGYVVTKDRRSITAIGEKAFYKAANVRQIEISGQVRYIGDSAFESSGISSLTIGNAYMIGNRAFAGCSTLKTVTFEDNSNTNVIGAEAFYGSGINSKLSMPYTVNTIGHGAFAECTDLSEVEFDQANGATDLQIKDYAFYNDKALTKVDFGKIGAQSMGTACFAIQSPSGDAMTEFSFPSARLNNLSDYVLANRRGLVTVNIPFYQSIIPDNTFYNCFGLAKVQFSDDSANAKFNSKLFYDVTNSDFCVYGPEFYDGSNPAWPRQSTWDAERKDGVAIPYVYESGGKTYYEVAYESEDGTRYRYGAGNDGELISCALISGDGLVDIVVPSQIGQYKINRIGSTCFSDQELRSRIRSVTIQNNSVSEIASGTFRDLPKLVKVRIGNSVTTVGDNAFAGSKNLVDVYFATPSAGYASVTLGNNAFATTGRQLTLHGDIVKGYAPFDYAANPANVLKDPEDTSSTPALNVCYQSLWDSTTGTHLTAISDKSGNMTLVDYPKISDLSIDNIRNDDELQDYCNDMENYYYYTVYDSGSNVETLRRQYALIWNAKENSSLSVTVDGKLIEAKDYDTELNARYGPWINPNYCGDGTEAGYWTSYLDTASNSNGYDLFDMLFEPIIARAASNPIPYFTAYPYNFMENYESYLSDPNYSDLPDYKRVPDQVWNYINATQSIVVPDGIDSIDVYTYSRECSDNYNTYIKNDRPTANNDMYTSIKNGATPGLFSGYYVDYEDGDSRETNPNGNDYIKSVVLTSVKSLPDYAFDSCEQLERVELGAVEKVGALPFRDCPNLIYLTGSEKYPAENGILYEKRGEAPETYKIVECLLARGKSGTGNEALGNSSVAPSTDSLISSVTEIADSAFEGCNYITIVDLSTAEGLEIIPVNCFKDCERLTILKLPRTVTKVMAEAFDGVTSSRFDVYIPGREVDISDDSFNPKDSVIIHTYEDSAAYRYAKRHDIRVEVLEAYRVMFFDYDGTQVGTTQIVDTDSGGYATEPAEAEALKESDHRPGYTFSGWVTTGGKTLQDKITDDMTIFVAQYTADGTMVNGRYVVEFLDGIDGRQLSGLGANEQDGKYYIEAGTSFTDNGKSAPMYPTHDGYTFLEWSNNWTENTVINSNMTIIALYSADPSGSGSGNGGNTSGGSTSGGGNGGSSSNTSNRSSSSSTTSSSTSSSSTSTSSTTSGSDSTVAKYTVTVVNGNGSGSYDVGSTVVIAANEPAPGTVFQRWTTDADDVALASVSMSATTFTMPAKNVTVTANYVAATSGSGTSSSGSTGGNSGSTSRGNGSTLVDITKPGISNKDLATANTNGSTDNFIVKITETDEATRAVAEALTNKYGSLDNILYYAMDISLYDSTGTVKISDTTGITVDITIPIPDALVAYGGNNMAGAVINGNQLESLNESFTTINGVPCIRFTATHFSPYTIYVDTGNLTEGMLDTTPKTGDPIHPKWFLSIGLACLSVILFMKKDKAAKVKAA